MNAWHVTPAAAVAREAVLQLLRAADPGAFGPHFQHQLKVWTENEEPAPLLAARAAHALARAVQDQLIAYVLLARGDGETWQDVATTLDLHRDGSPDVAAAYLQILGRREDDTWWSPATGVAWDCATCQQSVRDLGPEHGGPDDRESGHAPGCTRHLADVIAWDGRWT